ncbi:hypothetical protein HALLA_12090 [Halostagnicola larsenii XH-48]|uniref:Uncharacterized protein n=1 Tax=Halostagnicola larsenii XH-48 TaxID=797299 RepID=W0JUN5_9EURY|nr:hypothetical protein [Halostagnicola larsenii]AHG00916.1 hypothetical protein HALLA_11790 [Halostagnicola larsenii XH-48]AHG00965.1 hypothetical protein HALLA_12090 [Halostagnicola larsenii XH-48]
MDINWIEAVAESVKYLAGGFAGAFVTSSLDYDLPAQISFFVAGMVMLFVLVIVSRKIDPDNQDEMLEDAVRESVEETVPKAVQESIREELQVVDQQKGD